MAVCAGSLLTGCSPTVRPRPAGARPPLLADYNREIREPLARADGIRHVDSASTIARLRDINVTTYFYLVYHAKTDWADFAEELLPAAEHAGIRVWVYLVPPSECCSQPFGADFERWAGEIARLSRRHTNLA